MKLLSLSGADRCYMGEKDYQQFMLVREMADSFFLPTQIVPCPVVREPSGLAMSSRNERLSPQGREKAALLFQLLNSPKPCAQATQELTAAGFAVEYFEEMWGRRFVAASFEGVRLIDNVEI
jgi:pantoate--beta-alanine ligase